MIHQRTSSKSIVNYLHQLGISVSYPRILRIETQLAETVLAHSAEHNVFVPPSLVKATFIFFSADNSDFHEDTPEGKNTLRATAMVVFQLSDNKHNTPHVHL